MRYCFKLKININSFYAAIKKCFIKKFQENVLISGRTVVFNLRFLYTYIYTYFERIEFFYGAIKTKKRMALAVIAPFL